MKELRLLKILAIGGFATVLTSCGVTYGIRPAGDLSMVATRNVDRTTDYKQLQTYVGISKTDLEAAKSKNKRGVIKAGGVFGKPDPIIKEINTYKAKLLQEAVDNVVKSVPGGEFLYNANFYTVVEVQNKLFGEPVVYYNYICSGDVWGVNDGNADIKGFRVGDEVVFTYTKDLRKELSKDFKGEMDKQYPGKIVTLKGGHAVIKLENGTIVDIPYSALKKT